VTEIGTGCYEGLRQGEAAQCATLSEMQSSRRTCLQLSPPPAILLELHVEEMILSGHQARNELVI
jgi:hypothetical protein